VAFHNFVRRWQRSGVGFGFGFDFGHFNCQITNLQATPNTAVITTTAKTMGFLTLFSISPRISINYIVTEKNNVVQDPSAGSGRLRRFGLLGGFIVLINIVAALFLQFVNAMIRQFAGNFCLPLGPFIFSTVTIFHYDIILS